MNPFGYLQDPASWTGPAGILRLLLQHLGYTASAVALAALVAVPLGVLTGHTRRGRAVVTGLSGAARAVPSLGLLVLAALLLGTGTANIVVVLAVLALPTIAAAVAAGVAGADRAAVQAGRALGMSEGQLVRQLEWPLALPLVVTGLRRASVQVVATATVAAFASGGGLGRLLSRGQAAGDYPQMFAGAVVLAALAVLLDLLLRGVGGFAGRRSRPRTRTAAALTVAAA